MKPILIVDDSLTVRMDLRDALAAAGFETVCCETLAEARTVLARQPFALVVLDILLPDGDGIDLLREIKPGGLGTPVLLLSSEAEVADRVRGLETGADDYVGKPYDTGYLVERARQLAGAPETGGEHGKILVVDESTGFREEIRPLLEREGFRVASAQGGDEGLRLAAVLRPEAILVAQTAPGTLGGPAMIRRLRQDVALRGIPCVLLAASADPCQELAALEAGADASLARETDPAVILARVLALLRSPARLGEPRSASLLGAKRILTVDDSVTYLNALSDELHQEGYDVVRARSGREALHLLEVQPVDCILLDVRMPELSGHETCRIIRKTPQWRNIPVVMLTAVEEPEAMVEGIHSGADDYIPKSSDFAVVKARVLAQLRRHQIEEEYRTVREQLLQKELQAEQASHAQALAEARAALVDELERKNQDMEAFSYSVSHDLRGPLRAIQGFAQMLEEEYREQLPEGARHYLERVRQGVTRMHELIEALLQLSRVERAGLQRSAVDVSALAREIARELAAGAPQRRAEMVIPDGITGEADARLLRAALENLLGNAWKFTARSEGARIEVGAAREAERTVYFVRDNGAGFDASKADKLFTPFQRMHSQSEFPGTGIGLATVRRIVERHGGKVWAESAPGRGATFYFTLGPKGS